MVLSAIANVLAPIPPILDAIAPVAAGLCVDRAHRQWRN
jgi:hypothetical protein